MVIKYEVFNEKKKWVDKNEVLTKQCKKLRDQLKDEEKSIEEVKQLVLEMKEGMGVSKE